MTNEIETAITKFCRVWSEANVSHVSQPGWNPEIHGNQGVTFEPGKRYGKCVKREFTGHCSVQAFIDMETGDVYKAAGWKAPAKGIRGNVSDAATLARITNGTGWLYR